MLQRRSTSVVMMLPVVVCAIAILLGNRHALAGAPDTGTPSPSSTLTSVPTVTGASQEKAIEPEWFKLAFEPDAYYTSLGLYIALTRTPIPHVGEKSEKDLYLALLSRAFAPRFLVIGGSVNPLPYLGTYIKEHHAYFYEDAQITGSFNWVLAITAGFEEPYAVSLFLGNVLDFSVPERPDSGGSGTAVSCTAGGPATPRITRSSGMTGGKWNER